MANLLQLAPGWANSGAFTSMGFTASDFNGLADGRFVLASSAIDNATNKDIFVDVSGQFTVGSTTTSSSYLLIWLLPLNRDGTTYGDGTTNGANLPGWQYLRASCGVRIGATNGSVAQWGAERIMMPRRSLKWGISVHMGGALNASAGFQGEFQASTINLNA